MLAAIHPKLPMRNKAATKDFYINQLGFQNRSDTDYERYLILRKDSIEIHFFEFKELNPLENYGQVYIRVGAIDSFYQLLVENGTPIHPNAPLQIKPWGQKEFSILDPDHNLLTFGEGL